ncbi:acyl-CoA Delta(11) desaturase [Bombyx mori]|uniref:Fatty acid desaturase domain-containing protein n=1 Tax=Bombyx mori TaxID=7091 RepID=A0A8R2QTK3_BOMMO|nr:acyl-CoA Delta(11) desaturase-like [Bombyx mori]
MFKKMFVFKNKIKWESLLVISLFHIFGFYWCCKYAFPLQLGTFLFAYAMTIFSGIGITCGVHRLWTHRSYKVKAPMKFLLMALFCSSGQNSIYNWVRDHRLHHKFADTDADPHNVKRGFFFSHIGWLMVKKNESVLTKGKLIDMSDIESDSHLMFEHKYHNQLTILFCFLIPTLMNIFLIGEDWKCAIAWQCFIRYLYVLHCELTVNSLAHMYGYKPYNENIEASENILVSVLTYGEGYHNFHHVFPFDFRAAETMDFFSLSTKIIRTFEKIGWTYDLKQASPEMIEAARNKLGGDGSKANN